MRLTSTLNICLFILAVPLSSSSADEAVKISAARQSEDGFLVHTIESPYQSGQTEIRVLLPDRLGKGKRYAVVYLLPVEPGRDARYGDGLLEVEKNDLHNKHQVIFVAPTFSQLPWYADHPTNPKIRQEMYFVKVVAPFVEKTYPASMEAEDRLLLGFSKSGWGAWTLLLRHPQTFGRAAAWDAPLMMAEIGMYGTSDIFGTQENFERYRPADLLRENAKLLRGEKRLILTGYGDFREHHRRAHDLLESLVIPHEYQDGPQRKHDWHSGWMPEAAELLIGRKMERTERQP
jgi:hypothetical protein